MSVMLVRHTRPAIEAGICYGRTDLAVADTFAEESREVLASLRDADVLITSPLLRCRKLASKIGTAFGLTPQIDERVQEIDFGSWENRPWSEIPRREIDAWADDFLHANPHGGESVSMLWERTIAALNDYRKSRLRHIVVTHSGVMKAAFAGDDGSGDYRQEFDYGAVVALTGKQEPGND